MKYKANKQGKKVKVNIWLPQNQYLKQIFEKDWASFSLDKFYT